MHQWVGLTLRLASYEGWQLLYRMSCYARADPIECESLLWALVPTKSALQYIVCAAGYVVFWCGLKLVIRYTVSLKRGSGEAQSQFPLVLGLGSLGRSYKVICSWLLFVLGLEALGRGYAVNQCWLPLVPGLGPFGRHQDAS